MSNEQAAAVEEEQTNILAEIVVNMMKDAEHHIAEQYAVMMNFVEQQRAKSTLAMGNMIKDAMLNLSASTGTQHEALKEAVARKKVLLDANGHTDETEGGSQD